AFELERTPEQTVFSLPLHGTRFVGTGPAPDQDHLAPAEIVEQLVDADSQLSTWTPLLKTSPQTWALLLSPLKNLQYLADLQQWKFNREITLQVSRLDSTVAQEKPVWQMELQGKQWQADLKLSTADPLAACTPSITYQQTNIERAELERQLSRGVRRALAVL